MSWDENPEGYRPTGGPQASTAHGRKGGSQTKTVFRQGQMTLPTGPSPAPTPAANPLHLMAPGWLSKSALGVTLTHKVLAVDLCLDPWGRCCTRGEEGRKATNTCPLTPVRWGTLPHFLLRVGAGHSSLFRGNEASKLRGLMKLCPDQESELNRRKRKIDSR